MFNRAGFNLLTFNVPVSNFVLCSANLSGTGFMSASANYEIVVSCNMDGTGTLELTVSQDGKAVLSGIGNLSVYAVKEVFSGANLSGSGSITADPSAYIVQSITFTGSFDTGDVITIDTDKLTLKQNGVNATNKITAGDFFNLRPGVNTIKYTDEAGSRSIKIVVAKRDRWL